MRLHVSGEMGLHSTASCGADQLAADVIDGIYIIKSINQYKP
jgi:hypothetical protein